MKVTINLILSLSNSFFHSFMKIKNEKWTVFGLSFSFFMKINNQWRPLKIQNKNLLNMKIVVNYLNFVFYVAQRDSSNLQTTLFRTRTLNHLAKLAKWWSCVVSTYLYGAFDCMFLSCHVRVFTVNPHSMVAWMPKISLIEKVAISEV